MIVASMKANFVINFTIKKPVIGSKVPIPTIKVPLPLEHILYIYHLMWFKKNQVKVQALLDSGNKVNTMTSVYMAKLGFKI